MFNLQLSSRRTSLVTCACVHPCHWCYADHGTSFDSSFFVWNLRLKINNPIKRLITATPHWVIIGSCKRTKLINAPIWRSQESPFYKFRLICMVKIGNHCSGLMLAAAKDKTGNTAKVCSHEFFISTRLIEVSQRNNNTDLCIDRNNGNETLLAHVLVCQISCNHETTFGWNTLCTRSFCHLFWESPLRT